MIRLAVHQTRYDLLSFVRNRQARFFTLLLPVIFLVIFVSVYGNQPAGPEHIKAATFYVPGIAALAVLSASFSNLVIATTTQRELGVLKRRRATPAPAAAIIAGRALASLVVSLAVAGAVIAIGGLVYGVHIAPGALGTLALSAAIGSLAFACLGYAVSTAIRTADAAQPTVLVLALPLQFISGVFIPPVNLPSALRHVAQAFPLQHLVAALSRGFLPGTHGVAWGDLAILAVWGAAGLPHRARALPLDPGSSHHLTHQPPKEATITTSNTNTRTTRMPRSARRAPAPRA
jgi:ABC-2 type transport system permease protein